MNLWLDDRRPAPEGWTWVKNAAEAIRLLDTETVEQIALDHDLGDTGRPEITGYDVALHLAQRASEGKAVPGIVRIHTANPVGRDRNEGVRRYLPGSLRYKPDALRSSHIPSCRGVGTFLCGEGTKPIAGAGYPQRRLILWLIMMSLNCALRHSVYCA